MHTFSNIHISQQRKARAQPERIDGHTTLIGLGQNPGRTSLQCQSVDRTACNVQIRVGRREDEYQDAGIENIRERLDARQLDGDDVRRGSSAGLLRVGEDKVRGVIRNKHAKKEDGDDVEEDDTVEGKANSPGNDTTRVLSLADCDTDKLGSEISKSGSDKGRPNRKETSVSTSSQSFLFNF